MEFLILGAVLVLCANNYFRLKHIERVVNNLDHAQRGLAVLFALWLGHPGQVSAQDQMQNLGQGWPSHVRMMSLSPQTRSWYRNPDGSCVQCSIGMAGVHCNDPNAASLLWDTQYGPAERGGSVPSRVEAYCDRRGITAWSVTGATVDDTMPWIQWAAKTGRFAAVGCGSRHFQTVYGYDQKQKLWYVCNNNSTDRIDRYTDQQFRQLHRDCGPWCVILEKSSSPPPQMVRWWK